MLSKQGLIQFLIIHAVEGMTSAVLFKCYNRSLLKVTQFLLVETVM